MVRSPVSRPYHRGHADRFYARRAAGNHLLGIPADGFLGPVVRLLFLDLVLHFGCCADSAHRSKLSAAAEVVVAGT